LKRVYLWIQGDEPSQIDLPSGEIVATQDVPGLGAVGSDGSDLWLLAETSSTSVSAIQLDPVTGQPIGDGVDLGTRRLHDCWWGQAAPGSPSRMRES
jgi:hypothetical protein